MTYIDYIDIILIIIFYVTLFRFLYKSHQSHYLGWKHEISKIIFLNIMFFYIQRQKGF